MTPIEVLADRGSHVHTLLELAPVKRRTASSGRIGLVRTKGAVTITTGPAVAWLLIEGGAGQIELESASTPVNGRHDVFEAPGFSALVGPGHRARVEGDLRCSLAWRRWDQIVNSVVLPPSGVQQEQRGSGPSARTVRTYWKEGPLICGETLNPPGGWSSYPPHRHEHEEVYLYRFEPRQGFGVAMEYGRHAEPGPEETACIVRDGSARRITSGFHPVVSAPGYTMYYLWALAGISQQLEPSFDPVHESLA